MLLKCSRWPLAASRQREGGGFVRGGRIRDAGEGLRVHGALKTRITALVTNSNSRQRAEARERADGGERAFSYRHAALRHAPTIQAFGTPLVSRLATTTSGRAMISRASSSPSSTLGRDEEGKAPVVALGKLEQPCALDAQQVELA